VFLNGIQLIFKLVANRGKHMNAMRSSAPLDTMDAPIKVIKILDRGGAFLFHGQ